MIYQIKYTITQLEKKWNKMQRIVKVSDIVLLYDSNTPKSY